MKKSTRQEKLLELIKDHDIMTQEQLLKELAQAGFKTTQATISRDFKNLRIVKELSPNGCYRYTTSAKPAEHAFSAKLNLIFQQCVTSCAHAQNMIVLKTMPGLASAACSALDKLNMPEILGTIAGDDTCFVVVHDEVSANAICEEIKAQIEH